MNLCQGDSIMLVRHLKYLAVTFVIVMMVTYVSSPVSGAYLYENMIVVGSAEIIESFTMYNIRPGAAVSPAVRADHFFKPDLSINSDPVPKSSTAPVADYDKSSSGASEKTIPIVLPNSGQGSRKDDSAEVLYGKLFAFYVINWFDLF